MLKRLRNRTKRPHADREDAPPITQPAIWRLPPELLERIFSLAYQNDQLKDNFHLLITPRRTFETQQNYLRTIVPCMNHFKIWTSFPQLNLSNYLVSKDWFLYAMNSMFAEEKFVPSTTTRLTRTGCGIFMQFARDVSLRRAGDMEKLRGMRCLRAVQVQISWHWFLGGGSGKEVWREEFDEDDFRGLEIYERLLELRGLKDLILIPESFRYAKIPESMTTWARNVAKLRALVLPYVTSPREDECETEEGPRPLYVGSRVRIDSNKLLDEDHVPCKAVALVEDDDPKMGMYPGEVWYWFEQHKAWEGPSLGCWWSTHLKRQSTMAGSMFPELFPEDL